MWANKGINDYDGVFPKELDLPTDLTVLKATKMEGSPFAVCFNYSLYPDVLIYASDEIPAPDNETMTVFSADVVGYTRKMPLLFSLMKQKENY